METQTLLIFRVTLIIFETQRDYMKAFFRSNLKKFAEYTLKACNVYPYFFEFGHEENFRVVKWTK